MDKPIFTSNGSWRRAWTWLVVGLGYLAIHDSWAVSQLNAQHSYGAQYGSGQGSLLSIEVNSDATEMTCTWESTIFGQTSDKISVDQYRGGQPQDPNIGTLTSYTVTQGGATPLGLSYETNGPAFLLKVTNNGSFDLTGIRKTVTVDLTDATFQDGDVLTVTHSGANGTEMKYVDVTLDIDEGQQGPTLSDFVLTDIDCDPTAPSVSMSVRSSHAWQYTGLFLYKCDLGGANVDYASQQGSSQGALIGSGAAEALFLGNGTIAFYDWEYCYAVLEVYNSQFDETPAEIITTWFAITCNGGSGGEDCCCCEKLDAVISQIQISNGYLQQIEVNTAISLSVLEDIRDEIGGDLSTIDTDGDGKPDYMDPKPDDPDIVGESSDGPPESGADDETDWELLGPLGRFVPDLGMPGLGIDVAAITEQSLQVTVPLEVPGLGGMNFVMETMPAAGTTYGDIMTTIRLTVRPIVTAFAFFGFGWVTLRWLL